MMKKFWGSQHIEKVAGFIQAWDADIVFISTRPGVGINDYHPSNNEGTFRTWVRVSYK
jgi:hypothetical protein